MAWNKALLLVLLAALAAASASSPAGGLGTRLGKDASPTMVASEKLPLEKQPSELKRKTVGAALRQAKEDTGRPIARRSWLKERGDAAAEKVPIHPAVAGAATAVLKLGTAAWKEVSTRLSHAIFDTAHGKWGAAAALVGLKFATDEGIRRATFFWFTAVPVYIHYQIVDRTTKSWPVDKRQAAFEALHEKYAPTLLYVFHTLGGFYIKIGQNGASREDFVPKQFTDRLATLEDAVPPEADPGFARRIVQRSLGKPIKEVFLKFEDNPLGSASIGQCHLAQLLDGTPVVVKVMRPAAKRIFEGDVGTLESFCRLAQPHIVPTFEEVRKQFGTEFNYTEEAINMELVGDAVNPDWEGRVRVPRPIMDLCRENILVMEYIPGVKLVEAVKRQAREEARRRGITLEDLKDQHMAWMRRPPSCLTWLSSLRRAATMKVARVVLSCAWAPRKVAHWAGCCGERPPPPLQMPVDPSLMLKRLLDVHADQLFKYGAMNGDPHPGNVLLMPDGRLGLIDFGQVTLLSLEHRLLYAQLIVALASHNRRKVVQIYHRMGYSTKFGNEDVCVAWATILNDRDDASVLEGYTFQGYMEELQRRDPIKSVPERFITVQRATVLLRGCAIALGCPVSIAQAWAPAARALLGRHGRHSVLSHSPPRCCGLLGTRPAKRALVICGPSGVGKGTLIARLMDEFKGKIAFCVSHTTRGARQGEVHGVDYHFTSRAEIEHEITQGRFLEHAAVHGNVYGTSWKAVDHVRKQGKMCVLDIDVKGCVSCRDRDLEGVYVFIAPPSVATLRGRLEGRGTEGRHEIARRVAAAHAEIKQAKTPGLFDVTIVNDKLDDAYAALRDIVVGEIS